MKVAARVLPPRDGGGGWLEILPAPAPPRTLDGEIRADCAVLGAGFTGLAAARRLAELRPGWRVVLLEAGRAGSGASGRSSGFVVDRAGFIAAMPAEHGERFIRLSRAGIAELERSVREHGIACDWDARGFFHAAASEVGLRSLESLRGWLERRGEAYEWLDRRGMEEVTGSSFYRAGLRLPGSILVQAGALSRGLVASLPGTVELYEETPVTRIEGARPFRLRAGEGQVIADHLVVALNGYGPALGFWKRRLFPLLTFGSLSAPLTGAQQRTLAGDKTWGLLAQDPMGSSLRRTRDQRLLIRNTLTYRRDVLSPGDELADARETHRRTLTARFPELAGLELEHTWSGVMGASPNLYPFFGRMAENAVGAGGFTGAGIAMGTICGKLLAELIVGSRSRLLDDVSALPGPRWLPPEPFLSTGIRWRVRRMNASAGKAL